jgi:hypothetical protein
MSFFAVGCRIAAKKLLNFLSVLLEFYIGPSSSRNGMDLGSPLPEHVGAPPPNAMTAENQDAKEQTAVNCFSISISVSFVLVDRRSPRRVFRQVWLL